uniref:ABC-2 type transporter domain-containing protein n=1 Tax=Aureoumbra lagunensis TaxID=44058 RepID=A0A7S3NNP9_9STRA
MAVELAANPSILFLDEPTSGLDSRAALVVIRAVANISASGRSVICTIHQPSYALFSTFDYLLLLKKGGHTVYFGPLGNECSALVGYLNDAAKDLGYELPPLQGGTNPATWMLTVCEQKVADFSLAYQNSPLGKHNTDQVAQAQIPDPQSEPLTFDTEFAVDDMTQYFLCCKRLAITYWRSPAYNVPRLMVSIFLAYVYGSCYMYKVDDLSDSVSRVAFMFMTTFNQGVIYCNVAIPVMAAERASFYRERASRFYKVGPYAASFTIVELPFLIFFSLVFVACVFSIVDMYSGIDKFLWYWAFYFSYVTLLTFMGQFLVVALPNFETAQSVASTFFSIFACFCGFTIAPDDIPSGWKFLFYANPAHYVLEGQVVTQFRNVHQKIIVPGLSDEWTLSRYMTSGNSDSYWSGVYTWGHRYGNIVTLIIFFCGIRFATILAFTKIAYVTR